MYNGSKTFDDGDDPWKVMADLNVPVGGYTHRIHNASFMVSRIELSVLQIDTL